MEMRGDKFRREELTKATPVLYLTHKQLIKSEKEVTFASHAAGEAKRKEQEGKGLCRSLAGEIERKIDKHQVTLY